MKRALSNKERRALNIKTKQAFAISYKHFQVIIADVPLFLLVDGQYIPTLHNETVFRLPHVEVDRGAVPFILKGANVLRPGILSMGSFKKGQPVVVLYERVPIAVGVALVDSEEARAMSKGSVVKTLHYKGDAIWKHFK